MTKIYEISQMRGCEFQRGECEHSCLYIEVARLVAYEPSRNVRDDRGLFCTGFLMCSFILIVTCLTIQNASYHYHFYARAAVYPSSLV